MLPKSHLENFPAGDQIQPISEKDSNTNVGKWTTQQNLKYAIFMDFHKVTLSSRQKKKNFKVFEEMARFIASRNTVQCRSHHQKLQERFKNFKKIISAFKNEIGRKQYKVEFKKWTNSGQGLVFIDPQIKQNPENIVERTKEPTVGEESKDRQVQGQNKEFLYTPGPFAFYTYRSTQNNFIYSLPSIYPFTVSYYV